jgi:hypothetical protein
MQFSSLLFLVTLSDIETEGHDVSIRGCVRGFSVRGLMLSSSELQSRFFQVEVTFDPVHSLVPDPALVAQADESLALHLEQLPQQALVSGRAILQPVLVVTVESVRRTWYDGSCRARACAPPYPRAPTPPWRVRRSDPAPPVPP